MNRYDWIVVIRKTRDPHSFGMVINSKMSQDHALKVAREYRKHPALKDYNIWAMPRCEY